MASKFEQFVQDVDKKFADIESLLKTRPPKVKKEAKGEDFKLLREQYDERLDGLSTEVASLKEMFTGIKEKADKIGNGPNNFFREFFLGY